MLGIAHISTLVPYPESTQSLKISAMKRRNCKFDAVLDSGGLTKTPSGLKFEIQNRFDNPTVSSTFYILYGKVEADIQASSGQGIISSLYLQSDDLDEIDVAEIFGGNVWEYQTNFFVKGNISTYDRGEYHPMNPPPMSQYHRYGIEWTVNEIKWLLNGRIVRVLKRDNPHKFPTSPMIIRFSLWAGGDPSNSKGTVDWAGGLTDYRDLPYVMHVKDLVVYDYVSGDAIICDSIEWN